MQGDLEKYRRDFAIVRETAAQIIKDFNMAGFEITFSGNELLAYEELKAQITPILWDLFKSQPSHFQNLLYRIDIDERHFNNFLKVSDPFHFSESIAGLILQREFQKVLSRKYYS